MKMTEFIDHQSKDKIFEVFFIYEPFFVGSLPPQIRHDKHGTFQIKNVIDTFNDNKDVQIRQITVEKL